MIVGVNLLVTEKEVLNACASITKLSALPGIKGFFTAHYGYTDSFQRALSSWKDK